MQFNCYNLFTILCTELYMSVFHLAELTSPRPANSFLFARFAMTLKLLQFRPQVDSPDDVSLGLKSIRPMTCNVLQQGEHSYQRCSFNSVCIPYVQSLIFHAYSSSKDDEFISGESTLVEADCRRANRPSGETSWYHEAQTVFLIFQDALDLPSSLLGILGNLSVVFLTGVSESNKLVNRGSSKDSTLFKDFVRHEIGLSTLLLIFGSFRKPLSSSAALAVFSPVYSLSCA